MNDAPTRSAKEHFRFTVVPIAVLATLLLVTVVGAAIVPEGDGQLGGDFPAFYGAGVVVADYGYDDLYDPVLQRAAQEGLIAHDGGYLFFAYPPFVAAGYSLLARLGYRGAYIVQMLAMWAAAIAAVFLLRSVSDFVRRFPLAVLALVLLFQPTLASLVGGQNTILTMFLFVAAARSEMVGRPVLAGVAVGLMAYKPQYGVPLAILVVAAGKWRVLAGTAATWLGLYLAGAAALGVAWVGPWWTQATAFRDINATVNGQLFISWAGFLEHVSGVGGSAGRALGLAIGAAGLLALTWLWRRPEVGDVMRYAAAAVGLVMIAPQSLFYEAGIAAVTLLLMADLDPRLRGVAVVAWSSGWLYVVTADYLNTGILVAAMTAVAGIAFVGALGRRTGESIEVAV